MKVVHLCTQDNGGAGNAAYRLNTALRNAGIDSKLIVLTKTKENNSVYAIPDNYFETKSLINNKTFTSQYFFDIWGKWQNKIIAEYPSYKGDYEIFTLVSSNIELSGIPEIEEADVINLHWVNGMLSFTDATKELFKRKKIIWTLHDMNPFTGGCHYSAGCDKFIKRCGACPQLGSENPNDLSAEVFKIKENFYKGLEINIVTPSKWLSEEAKKSALFQNYTTSVIPNGFPTKTFFPYPSEIVREKLNIPKDAKLILIGAAYSNNRKGFELLLETLEMIEGDEKIYLGVFGNLKQIPDKLKNFEIIQFGSVDDEKILAMLYSAADVFVIPSLQDNLPNVVPEAMLCGTPVVGFNIGGLPDMIEHKVNGYLAEPYDTTDLATGIVWTLNSLSIEMRKQTYESALKKYSFETQSKNYIQLYKKILLEERTKNKKINLIIRENNFPKISIVTPSYNQGEFLEETINSVLEQNYPNLEYIIMDGGSADNSVEIIKKYEKYLAYWQSKPDGGQYSAITEGFNRSTGEIMTWINSDDFLSPLSLLTVASIFKHYKNIDWLTGRNCMHYQQKNLTAFHKTKFWNRKDYLGGNYKYIQQEGTFWRRELYDKAGGYVNSDYKLASDLELWVRFFRHSNVFALDVPLGTFRSHGNQKSVNLRKDYEREAEEIIKLENQRVSKSGEKLEDRSFKISIAAVKMLSFVNKDINIEEKIKELEKRIKEEKIGDNLLAEINSAFYYAPEEKRLYQLLMEFYDKKQMHDLANILLWRATSQFNDPDFLSKLILLELSLGHKKNVNLLVNEFLRLWPNHPFIKNILEFENND